MNFHPIADLFPLMSPEELAELTADIKKHGLRECIVTYEGMILDGRNRQTACEKAGVLPAYVNFDSIIGRNDSLAFIVSQNLHRRHLSVSQRAMIAVRLKTMLGEKGGLPPGKKSRDAAAETMGVSPRSVQSAVKVAEEGIPSLASAVAEGGIAVDRAAKIAGLPASEQLAAIQAAEKNAQRADAKQRAKALKRVVLHLKPKVFDLLRELCETHGKDESWVVSALLQDKL